MDWGGTSHDLSCGTCVQVLCCEYSHVGSYLARPTYATMTHLRLVAHAFTGRELRLDIAGNKQQQQKQGGNSSTGNLREKRNSRQAAATALVQQQQREPKPLSLMVTNLPLRMRSTELNGLFRGFSVIPAASVSRSSLINLSVHLSLTMSLPLLSVRRLLRRRW